MASLPDPEVIYTDPATGERFRRTGACNRCGRCCTGPGDPSRIGPVPGMCSLLRYTGMGVASCVGHGHDPYFMLGCWSFPSKPIHTAHIPECGYAWEREG